MLGGLICRILNDGVLWPAELQITVQEDAIASAMKVPLRMTERNLYILNMEGLCYLAFVLFLGAAPEFWLENSVLVHREQNHLIGYSQQGSTRCLLSASTSTFIMLLHHFASMIYMIVL